jgi:hypothetical protein
MPEYRPAPIGTAPPGAARPPSMTYARSLIVAGSAGLSWTLVNWIIYASTGGRAFTRVS